MTASPLMMWYKMANKDSAMCGPYSMGNFCPHSCCTAKKAFCKDNNYVPDSELVNSICKS